MIRLLVVDDSPLMRRVLREVFAAQPDFEVEVARSGPEALERLEGFAPDVITLDIHMPEMDGLACLDRIMVQRPCPVVMVSALDAQGADATLEAMELGAVDFVPKPARVMALAPETLAPMLVERVRQAAGARIPRTTRLRERVRLRAAAALPKPRRRPAAAAAQPAPQLALIGREGDAAPGVVLVGTSTGGPPALDMLLGGLPSSFPWPIVVAQHMPATFTGPLARRLDRLSALTVTEVTVPLPLEPGGVYIGAGDADVILSQRSGQLIAMPAPSSEAHLWHPSVDRLVESAMRVLAPERLIGVLMTGMGDDGAAAMAELQARGGRTIAESKETAVVWGMPGALATRGGADAVCPLERIAPLLAELVA